MALASACAGNLEGIKMKFPVLSPATRSVLLAVIGGMMAASYLHDRGVVDLSYGFAPGSFPEGALMALIGGLGGGALLLAFRKLRDVVKRAKGR